MEESTVNIHIATTGKNLTYKCSDTMCAEDLCTLVCKDLKITPLAKHLFCLQVHGTKIFLANNSLLNKIINFDLRIRYKVPNLIRLKQLDSKAYNYYFHQAKNDVLNNNVPEIIYSKYREELLGLGIADMYRVMVEEGRTHQDVMKEYKKYIPREVTKKHSIFTKKPIYDTLFQLQKTDLTPSFIIEKYLSQFEALAPNYLSEDYKVTLDVDGSFCDGILYVMPFHKDEPGLRLLYEKENKWEYLCSIEELCFMSIRNDCTVEISRVNGIPIYMKFTTDNQMYSFVSVCDGYYRLMIKWTFNICKDVTSLLLKKLHAMKCHGPVGGEFSYHKLEEKRSNKPGCFILRQCELKYEIYYIDVCIKNCSKPITYKIEKRHNGFIFDEKDTEYKNITDIISAHKNSEDEIFFSECLPPSEYDKSQVLLCATSSLTAISHIDQDDLENLLIGKKAPQCIDSKDLQLFKGTKIEGSEKISYFYKVRWNVAQGKKIDVGMKMLKSDSSEKYFKEFIEIAGQWAFLNSTSIIKLYGVSLRSPVAMIVEFSPFGPLDVYLRTRSKDIKIEDLVEASASLATALWYLAENGIIHGKIRCKKLLVSCHDLSKFSVKLADQGLHVSYKDHDLHWIPIECYNNFETARKSTAADVWSCATTFWEIFSFGNSPINSGQQLTKKDYLNRSRLSIPRQCPREIYAIMEGCWHADPHSRTRPHVIMRDVNHLLYQVFNSRRTHNYAKIDKPSLNNILSGINFFASNDDAEDDFADCNGLQPLLTDGESEDDTISYDLSNNIDFEFSNRNIDRMQNIYEFEGYNVILQGMIGKGFYGLVFKGALQKDGSCESREVAVKKLKSNTERSQLDDFDNEIKIAKNLKHRNIVEILGVVEKPEILLIMEFIQHGSLKCYLNMHRLSITRQQLLHYALDVACGMEYLETMHVVHRDLAARNILVVNENHVKISDFGLAREMDTGGYYVLKSNRALPLNWYAPESKTKGKFSTKSDVWSYGITLWEMYSFGMEPPPWDREISHEKLSNRLPCPASCPAEVYRDLMMACWEFIPTNRPTFTQLFRSCQKFIEDPIV